MIAHGAPALLACAVCFGGEASGGATAAVLFLLAVVVVLEVAIGRFFLRLVRNAAPESEGERS